MWSFSVFGHRTYALISSTYCTKINILFITRQIMHTSYLFVWPFFESTSTTWATSTTWIFSTSARHYTSADPNCCKAHLVHKKLVLLCNLGLEPKLFVKFYSKPKLLLNIVTLFSNCRVYFARMNICKVHRDMYIRINTTTNNNNIDTNDNIFYNCRDKSSVTNYCLVI